MLAEVNELSEKSQIADKQRRLVAKQNMFSRLDTREERRGVHLKLPLRTTAPPTTTIRHSLAWLDEATEYQFRTRIPFQVVFGWAIVAISLRNGAFIFPGVSVPCGLPSPSFPLFLNKQSSASQKKMRFLNNQSSGLYGTVQV